MGSSLLNIVDNLDEGLHKGKYINFKSCLEYVSVKNGLLIFNCSHCNKNYEKELDEYLAKKIV